MQKSSLHGYYRAQKNIEVCLSKQSKTLSLHNCDISDLTKLPNLFDCILYVERLILSNNYILSTEPISHFEKLRYLNLSNNNIFDVGPLEELKELENLDLSSNEISDIEPLKKLNKLVTLNLSKNRIAKIKPLENLKILVALDLSENRISNIKELSELNKLKSLNLLNNELKEIGPLENLSNLVELNLSENQVSNLEPLKNLHSLSSLIMWSNNISNLEPLQNLNSLSKVDLSGNKISDLRPIENLTKLNSLDLYLNDISNIDALQDLNQLKKLRLGENKLRAIPRFIFNLPNCEGISYNIIQTNQISSPPIEIVKQGKEAVLDWFSAKKEKFNEIKVLLVGKPGTGKTSLLKRLKFDKFEQEQEKTDGINIVDISFGEETTFKNQKKLHGIKGKFWDFGGQEIMNATHKLFLKNRSVYIMVLEARNDKQIEKQVREGIEEVTFSGGNSPIIVVANKIEENLSFDFVNTYQIKKDFPQVIDLIKISCSTREGLETLKTKLEEAIPKSGFFKSELDFRYIAVKEEIEEIQQRNDYLDEEKFDIICQRAKIKSKSQKRNLIDFLDKLGIALHFPRIKKSEFFVLDPNWVTAGLYRIITSKLASEQKGQISFEDLNLILNKENKKLGKTYLSFSKKEYTYQLKKERAFLAEVLTEYKLAFPLENNRMIIPSLLKGNPSDSLLDSFKKIKTLDFVYDYGIPALGMVPQILVDASKNLSDYWRFGCVISKNKCEALVQSNGNKIEINIKGENPRNRRNLMIYVRALMETINKDLPEPPLKLVPIYKKNNQKSFVAYNLLLNRLEKGKSSYIYNEDLDDEEVFQIVELLDGIASESEVNKKIDIILSLAKGIKTNTEISLENEELIHQKLDRLKEEITIELSNYNLEEKNAIVNEIVLFLTEAFNYHQDVVDDIFRRRYEEFKNSEDVLEIKMEFALPLLKALTGFEIKAEFDVKSWAKKMFEKHKFSIYHIISEFY